MFDRFIVADAMGWQAPQLYRLSSVIIKLA